MALFQVSQQDHQKSRNVFRPLYHFPLGWLEQQPNDIEQMMELLWSAITQLVTELLHIAAGCDKASNNRQVEVFPDQVANKLGIGWGSVGCNIRHAPVSNMRCPTCSRCRLAAESASGATN